MKTLKILLSFIFILPAIVYAAPADITRTLIIPFENTSDTAQFSASDKVGEMIMKSIRQFVGYVPTIEMPQTNDLRRFEWNSADVAGLARRHRMDYIIFGDYRLTGDPSFPDASIHIKIWSKDLGNFVQDQTYVVPFDFNFFDAMENIIRSIIGNSLNISIPDYAIIRLAHIDVGTEPHLLYVNRRYICIIETNDFNLNLKVYANQDYTVEIRRSENEIAYSAKVNIPAKAVTNLTYTAVGSIKLENVFGAENHSFSIMLNDIPVTVGQALLHLPSGRDYVLRVISSNETELFRRSYPLHDGDYFTVRADLNDMRRFRFNVYVPLGFDGNLASESNKNVMGSLFLGIGGGITMKLGRKFYVNASLAMQTHSLGSDAHYTARRTFVIPEVMLGMTYIKPTLPFMAFGIVLRNEWNVIVNGSDTVGFPAFCWGFGMDLYYRKLYAGGRLMVKITDMGSTPDIYRDDTMIIAEVLIGFGY